MHLLQVAYLSQSLLPENQSVSSDVLQRIFDAAQRHNMLHGITGYFVFDGARFAQIIEGEAASVRGTLLRITSDHRHGNIQLLGERIIAQRDFGPWVMGFSDLRPLKLAGSARQNFDEVKALLLKAARLSLVA